LRAGGVLVRLQELESWAL